MFTWLSPVCPLIPIADEITCMFYKAVWPWLLWTCGGLLLLLSAFCPRTTLERRWPPSAVVTALSLPNFILFIVEPPVEIALTDPKFISLILQTGPPDLRCKWLLPERSFWCWWDEVVGRCFICMPPRWKLPSCWAICWPIEPFDNWLRMKPSVYLTAGSAFKFLKNSFDSCEFSTSLTL